LGRRPSDDEDELGGIHQQFTEQISSAPAAAAAAGVSYNRAGQGITSTDILQDKHLFIDISSHKLFS